MFELERAKCEGAITRDGRKARIIGERQNASGADIIALIERPHGGEAVAAYYRDGTVLWAHLTCDNPADKSSIHNLQNLPQNQTWFVTSDGRVYESEAAAICNVRTLRKRGLPAGYAPVTITLTN